MSSDVALRIEGLGKRYTIRHKDHDHVTLAQAALHRLRHPRGGSAREEFWALKDVSFEVPRGQVLGVIGHNGAGKSTLLKILSRITPPSTGRVEVFGRIGSLLEVGTGFHPELTGRENIYLNGSILGMKTKEIDRQFDAIVDFSGVEKFLDTPVKRYSSGMYVRLAFAVAAHLDTEILLMDEVLAVGDAEFQAKCLGKMGEVARGGRTVIFVSHNMAAVQTLCTNGVLLDRGVVAMAGPVSSCVSEYASRKALAPSSRDLTDAVRPTYPLTGKVMIESAAAEMQPGEGDEPQALSVEVGLRNNEAALQRVAVVVLVRAVADGSPVAVSDVDGIAVEPGASLVRCRVTPFDVRPAQYNLTIAVTTENPRFGYLDHDCLEDCLGLDTSLSTSEGTQVPPSWGHVRLPGRWSTAAASAVARTGLEDL